MIYAYVLLGSDDYEGDTLLGVYKSPEDAWTAHDAMPRASFDDFVIYKVPIGAAPEPHFDGGAGDDNAGTRRRIKRDGPATSTTRS